MQLVVHFSRGSEYSTNSTYNIPSPKMVVTAAFCAALICNFFMNCAGRQRIAMSSKMSVTLEQTYITG